MYSIEYCNKGEKQNGRMGTEWLQVYRSVVYPHDGGVPSIVREDSTIYQTQMQHSKYSFC